MFLSNNGSQYNQHGKKRNCHQQHFPYSDLKKEQQRHALAEQMLELFGFDPAELAAVNVFQDPNSGQWDELAPKGEFREMIVSVVRTEAGTWELDMAGSALSYPELIIAHCAFQLSWFRLQIAGLERSWELNALAAIYFGFGLFLANTCQMDNGQWTHYDAFGLSNERIAYANALLCYICEDDAGTYVPFLNKNTQELFIKESAYLEKTSDTLLNADQVAKSLQVFTDFQLLGEAFRQHNYEEALRICAGVLAEFPGNVMFMNDLGYSLLQLKRYEEAVEVFDKALVLDPGWEYLYNNRGYCYLQLGDMEKSHADLSQALEIEPMGPFNWRNMGAWLLARKEYGAALEHFRRAATLDPNTSLIHFYLSKAYEGLGEAQQALHHRRKSQDAGEHNDSTLSW